MNKSILLIAVLCLASILLVSTNAALFAQPPQQAADKPEQSKEQAKPKQKSHRRLENPLTWTDAATATKESSAFRIMGEYVQECTDKAIQVVPVGDRFYLSIYNGGLPGDGWKGDQIEHQWVEPTDIGKQIEGWKKIDRSAKIEFPQPPGEAIVLFDGTDTKQWANAKVKNGLLQAGTRTRKKFRDFELHFETLLPFKPEYPLGHPDRGNSGVFAAGAYEVQVCDSFGVDFAPDRWEADGVIKTADTWNGSIYGIRAASVNMSLPPLSWQSFDVKFTAARFKDGKKISDARMTIHQNGVLIHDDFALPRGTGGGPKGPRPEAAEGPIYIQHHGNPTQYRNIWVIETKAETKTKTDDNAALKNEKIEKAPDLKLEQ